MLLMAMPLTTYHCFLGHERDNDRGHHQGALGTRVGPPYQELAL